MTIPGSFLAPGTEPRLQTVRLSGGHSVEIASTEDRALLRVGCDGDGKAIEVEIAWSAAGPVARLRAARVDLETTAELSLRCARFDVEATGNINLRAGGDLTTSAETVGVEARSGRIVARANDDVQLLGEQILLNCDRAPAIPEWVTQVPGLAVEELALADVSGDEELIRTIRGDSRGKENAPR